MGDRQIPRRLLESLKGWSVGYLAVLPLLLVYLWSAGQVQKEEFRTTAQLHAFECVGSTKPCVPVWVLSPQPYLDGDLVRFTVDKSPHTGDATALPRWAHDLAVQAWRTRKGAVKWVSEPDTAAVRAAVFMDDTVHVGQVPVRGEYPDVPWEHLLVFFVFSLFMLLLPHRPVPVIMSFVAFFYLANGMFGYRATAQPEWIYSFSQLYEGLSAGLVSVWIVAMAFSLFVAVSYGFGRTDEWLRTLREHRVAYTYVLPAMLGMAILVLVPFAFGVTLGFFNHCKGEYTFVGLRNFREILTGGGASITNPLNFWFTLGVTLLWTVLNVFLHVSIGLALALLLKDPLLKMRSVYRVLLILPWAMPNYITALMWKGMFQQQYGAVNILLDRLGLGGVSWFSSFWTAFTANVVTNTWLGFPFMMVVSLGALQSIPRSLYEAADVDGASPWQKFWNITLPLLRPALFPAIVMGSIWTFNMFNVIYLVSGGEPGGATDILITEAYQWAFKRGERYGLAAAYAVLIFIILLLYSWFAQRLTEQKLD